MFKVGLNPYGLAYTVGLQGIGTPRANPRPIGLHGFIRIAREIGARCIELDWRWLVPMSDAELASLRDLLAGMTPICSHWLAQQPGETLADAVRCATALQAPVVRLHLTPVLEGARASHGAHWPEMVRHARATLRREASRAADAGLGLAIENHQDFGSEELVSIAEGAGEHVGIVLDTGNPFSVGEDPVAFTRRAAHRIRHVHLKDYRAQFTSQGFRLVRCAVGDGCVPFSEIAALLDNDLTASIEIGALDARHIRLFTSAWWKGYPPRDAIELRTLLRRLRPKSLNPDVDYCTPWEHEAPGPVIVDYERDQIDRSVDNIRSMGWL
jgi:sugar phosphate isomerase/epimerase